MISQPALLLEGIVAAWVFWYSLVPTLISCSSSQVLSAAGPSCFNSYTLHHSPPTPHFPIKSSEVLLLLDLLFVVSHCMHACMLACLLAPCLSACLVLTYGIACLPVFWHDVSSTSHSPSMSITTVLWQLFIYLFVCFCADGAAREVVVTSYNRCKKIRNKYMIFYARQHTM